LSSKIFISYRREDEPGEARSIRDRLAQTFGDKAIFMDVDNLVAGTNYARELDAALKECAAFIAIIGPRWQEILAERRGEDADDYVVSEISSALNSQILVVPTLVRGAKIPHVKDLPPAISDLALRQAHTISHEKFSSDVSDLAKILQSKAKIGRAKPSAFRKLSYWVGGSALAILLVGALFFSRQPAGQYQVLVFTHNEGLTTDVAKQLGSALASSNVQFVVHQHVDNHRPDAIYISENAPAQLVREVIRRIPRDIKFIFPVDYATKSSLEMRNASIAVGLMSNFQYFSENSAERPYPISSSQLDWLSENGLDQTAFVERLKYIAPARSRSN
jgi:hypothetical protein